MNCPTCGATLADSQSTCPRCGAVAGSGAADYLELPDGRHLPLEKETVTLGRGTSNDVVLPVGSISRRHARLQRLPHGWLLIDLGSRNGTWVNGDQVVGPYLLQDGDSITLGDQTSEQRMTFRARGGPPSSAGPAKRVQAETVLGRSAFGLPSSDRPTTPDEHPTGSTPTPS